jgi:hypothetical protein
VKYKGMSYLHVAWVPALELEALSGRARQSLTKHLNALTKQSMQPYFDPRSLKLDPTLLAVEVPHQVYICFLFFASFTSVTNKKKEAFFFLDVLDFTTHNSKTCSHTTSYGLIGGPYSRLSRASD